MDRRSTSEEPESKGDEPFATNSTGEFVDIAEPLDFEEQLTNFDDGYALSDISPDMLKLLQESGVCMLNLEEKLQDDFIVYIRRAHVKDD